MQTFKKKFKLDLQTYLSRNSLILVALVTTKAILLNIFVYIILLKIYEATCITF